MKLVVNRCFGGFGLTPLAIKMAVEAGVPCEPYKFEQGHNLHKEDVKLEDLGNGFEVWGRPDSTSDLFRSVVKDGMCYFMHGSEIPFRSHPGLVATVEKLGSAANGRCAKLEIVEVPDGVEVEISEYDGNEHVAEKHRTW